MRRYSVFFAMLLSMTVFIVSTTHAAEEKMTGRFSLHSTKTEIIEVGDVPGHIMGVAQQTGVVFYSTGEIARKINTDTFDNVKGKGTFVDYSLYIHQDGSILYAKGGGTATPVDNGKGTALEGTFECTGGTGRFEGYRGTGTFKGGRIGDLKAGADYYFDFTMNCKKP